MEVEIRAGNREIRWDSKGNRTQFAHFKDTSVFAGQVNCQRITEEEENPGDNDRNNKWTNEHVTKLCGVEIVRSNGIQLCGGEVTAGNGSDRERADQDDLSHSWSVAVVFSHDRLTQMTAGLRQIAKGRKKSLMGLSCDWRPW